MENVWIVSMTDRTGNGDEVTSIYGAYSTEDKAMAAILYWIFENGNETVESVNEDSLVYTEYITDKCIWRIEKIEIDFVI